MTRRDPAAGLGGEFRRAIAAWLFSGRWWISGGHPPPGGGHVVPAGFAGVGVAAAADPRVDDWVIAQLGEAGLRHVRLDFSYGDADGPAGRFLDALLAHSFKVMLHLVQPFAAARRMHEAAAQDEWQRFVAATLDRFGSRVELVEVCSTVNRKRWAGYTLAGFLATWTIAHREVRARGLTLAGPNVTDFEPPFNAGLLALLRRRDLLPDIHTDNLFSERCTEPERFDHKILGRRLAGLIRVNLVRKARILQRIGGAAGVPRLMSPSAFWTLPRIERMLPDSEQKQADYLVRYLLLCAASGALERAWWGPLVCHREGLIDDGVVPYPELERITHYAGIGADIARYRVRPAFAALTTFARLIPGTRYLGRQNESRNLEVHAFQDGSRLIHAVWTINGRAAALVDLYRDDDLAAAEMRSRDGIAETFRPNMAGESPLYLLWPATQAVTLKAGADVLPGLAVHWHVPGKHHVHYRDAAWQGVVLAADAAEAERLVACLHPERIGAPPAARVLRDARNVIWRLPDPRDPAHSLVAKRPVHVAWHKRLLDRFKPSKALRSWSGTCELLRRGVAAAAPVAFFERIDGRDPTANHYVCEHIPAECTAREMALALPAPEFLGVAEDEALHQLATFLLRMHASGIFFRDLSGGNILIRRSIEGHLDFLLIDTGRLCASNQPLPVGDRIADLVRICNKMRRGVRDRFLRLYLSESGQQIPEWRRLSFALYNLKVVLKRRVGRKAIRRLFRSDGRRS